jgi:beta-xylosidase
VLYADYSDPDVCAVGEDFYLTASSFNCIPGLPILHSKDLVNWTIIGHALQELEPKEVFDNPAHGKGVWAPSIRYHNGEFYIYWGDPDYGIFMVKTKDPAGEWEKPVCVISGKGMIDPCPLWDTDGRCYLVNGWANSRAGFNSVLTVRELSKDGTKAIGQPRIVFDGGQENHTTEGPKFYKRDGYYWIMCPAGGVAMGWQLATRSKSLYGPYEWKKVMWQGKTDINGPHQGAWIHTSQDEDWFLHFNDKSAYGRVVYLQPVDWSSGWPIMGKNGEPVTTYLKPLTSHHSPLTSQESDEFNDGVIGKQWQWHANYHQFYGMPTANGTLRLYTYDLEGTLWDAPNLLLQKPTAPRFTATAKVRFAAKEDGQYGGLVMMGRDYSAIVVQRQGDSFLLQRHTCIGADEGHSETQQTIATLKATERDTIPYSPAIYIDMYLRMTVKDGICHYSYSLDGKRFKDAGEPFIMREGKWIGAKFGFVAECKKRKEPRGWLDVDWIRVKKIKD